MKVLVCRRCGRTRKSKCRRLCVPCYETARFDGTLHDYERVQRPLADFVEDFKELSARGMARAEVAAVMGYRPSSVERLISRARAAGLLPRPGACGRVTR